MTKKKDFLIQNNMRKFTPTFGLPVDLDDPKTYDHLPNNAKKLRELMFQEIGYVYCYMYYWHKDWFDNEKFSHGQKQRVELLIFNFTENEAHHRNDVLWFQEQVYIFQDEIENMC